MTDKGEILLNAGTVCCLIYNKHMWRSDLEACTAHSAFKATAYGIALLSLLSGRITLLDQEHFALPSSTHILLGLIWLYRFFHQDRHWPYLFAKNLSYIYDCKRWLLKTWLHFIKMHQCVYLNCVHPVFYADLYRLCQWMQKLFLACSVFFIFYIYFFYHQCFLHYNFGSKMPSLFPISECCILS